MTSEMHVPIVNTNFRMSTFRGSTGYYWMNVLSPLLLRAGLSNDIGVGVGVNHSALNYIIIVQLTIVHTSSDVLIKTRIPVRDS